MVIWVFDINIGSKDGRIYLLNIMEDAHKLKIMSSGDIGQLQTIVDFVSGMTDLYALDLYRKITGINLPIHS